jgi:predicted nucleic acid-binding protein
VNLYAESSAILSWLLGEAGSERVRRQLSEAELVVTSELTLVECDRALIRALDTDRITAADAADRRGRLERVSARWTVLHLHEGVLERARRPFPREPIRTLDALHLATALEARSLVDPIALLSLDDRIRASGGDLGLPVLPE